MRSWIAVVALCTHATIVSPARAYDEDGQFATWGVGTYSCGRLISDQAKGALDHYYGWIGGYLSAINRIVPTREPDILAGSDIDGGVQWIANYCASNPLDAVSDAAHQLFRHLMGQ